MKRLFFGVILVCLVMFLLPLMVIPLTNLQAEKAALPVAVPEAESGDAVTREQVLDPYRISVYQKEKDQVLELEFETYIAGIVAAELTPEFPKEAVKAQAVAARSYLLSKIADYKKDGIPTSHRGALLCDDFTHCRSYIPVEEAKDEKYIAQVKAAVEETRGEYLTYENQVVKAYFHKVSSGKTENVRDIWGVEIPYLVSAESPGDLRADGYQSRVFFPKDAFFTVIRGLRPELHLPEEWKEGTPPAKRTKAGSVQTITVFDEVFSGKEIAEGFGLRSRAFTLEFCDGQAIFDVKGNGHGVGMSQWGAKVMAEEGKGYQEILSHYYSGVSLTQLYQKQ